MNFFRRKGAKNFYTNISQAEYLNYRHPDRPKRYRTLASLPGAATVHSPINRRLQPHPAGLSLGSVGGGLAAAAGTDHGRADAGVA